MRFTLYPNGISTYTHGSRYDESLEPFDRIPENICMARGAVKNNEIKATATT